MTEILLILKLKQSKYMLLYSVESPSPLGYAQVACFIYYNFIYYYICILSSIYPISLS